MFISAKFALLLLNLSLVLSQVAVVELPMLPPAHLKIASPNDTLTFTGKPINIASSTTIKVTRNITRESDAAYRLEMIGLGLEKELGNLTEAERGFIEARDFRKKTMKAYQVWVDPEVEANFTQSRAQSIKRRLRERQGTGSSIATIESSWLMLMAPTASAAYCSNNDIVQWSCAACKASKFKDMTNIKAITKKAQCGELQAYVGFSPKNQAIIVTFRGSKNAGNWLCNLDAVTCNTRLSIGGKVHCGFQNAWSTIRAEVFKAIMDIASPFWPNGASLAYPIFFTGHSLGGALATFAAIDYLDTDGARIGYTASNIGLLTYGSPRIFDNAASTNFANKKFGVSFRAVHKMDPVPHLPFQFMAYRHVFREIFHRADESKVLCNDTPEKEADNCANSVFGASINDHYSFGGIPLGCGSDFGSLPDDARCIDFNGKTINCAA